MRVRSSYTTYDDKPQDILKTTLKKYVKHFDILRYKLRSREVKTEAERLTSIFDRVPTIRFKKRAIQETTLRMNEGEV